MKTTTTIRSTNFRLLAYSRIRLITAAASERKRLVDTFEGLASKALAYDTRRAKQEGPPTAGGRGGGAPAAARGAGEMRGGPGGGPAAPPATAASESTRSTGSSGGNRPSRVSQPASPPMPITVPIVSKKSESMMEKMTTTAVTPPTRAKPHRARPAPQLKESDHSTSD